MRHPDPEASGSGRGNIAAPPADVNAAAEEPGVPRRRPAWSLAKKNSSWNGGG